MRGYIFISAFLCFSCFAKKPNGTILPDLRDDAYESVTMQKDFDKQGHRGCRGLMPENTVPAMLYALGFAHVTTLEMDVVITKDKKVVLSHEPWMGHEITTKPNGKFVTASEEKSLNIYKMTYDEVKQYDVGMKPHPRFPKQQKMPAVKPLLSDLLDSVQQYMMTARRPPPYLNIETKCLPIGDGIYHPKPDEFVELLMAVIKEKQIEDYVIIQSFDFRTLHYLHKKYPAIKTAMLVEENDKAGFEKQLKKNGFAATIYSPHYKQVTKALVEKCHTKKMKLIPWTVNTKEEITRLKALGVDGVISDYPDLFD
jgi:glycerophosphoryl diester phosphodiesterase